MSKHYESIHTVVPHDNSASNDYSRTRKLGQRLEDLNSWAKRGYTVRHTRVFTHDHSEIYIDDLVNDNA
ncbi:MULTISPECIES: hypothetical protein [Curtobacterium]|uniref:Uncharacterized protein n=2 Tax=Curtobacterium TaxID=2034 RepID=A0A6G7GAX9_9MICO|nr:hypothetical protein [Curtobacterium flaccumfaciens]MBO9041491.1 hypothetical protein [Curtobacterium flaccumfaciens pv. flaccumfaciens]MBO9044977.1 hypothetical protein [Curtobacterium flaccumfaciens pv. flaccumfaciens]MBO9048880.1 hypothetical protein [Curtobacterium flaccumfaciens pv. flaccumfaciens]MBO9057731.1 hypothetical protein [Curtobacterium flaccumfaciens pv. flaccumfaciens]MBT1543170.1 hypothetical protein [Curtobacterium flaccumfaciens pv. flaccumfaciens]